MFAEEKLVGDTIDFLSTEIPEIECEIVFDGDVRIRLLNLLDLDAMCGGKALGSKVSPRSARNREGFPTAPSPTSNTLASY